MIRARRTGVAGFVAVVLGLHKMTPDKLLAFANAMRLDGRHGAADAAMAELRARAAL